MKRVVLRSTSGTHTHTPFPKPDSRPLDEWQRVSLEGNGGLVDEEWKEEREERMEGSLPPDGEEEGSI